MRKQQQRKILELLRTIKQAQTAGLYADCQSGAHSVGEFIEGISGEGTRTVALLEEYCELLFRAYSGAIGEKQLRRHLISIENSVRNELVPNRIEVAFFPYQLSMWDAFESIYLTAKDDPNCDAYCIPIPWFDRKHDGLFGMMHYDGNLYPKNIEITDWREYDVAARHPDVIFVHNAYEDNNYVTSVHPDYYCRRLIDFTDCLVYVPYFVSGENPSLELFLTPGLKIVDKIIAPSMQLAEKLQRCYKRDKILSLGSPKVDAAVRAASDKSNIPQGWKEMSIGKKVVFYNTSIGAFLQNNERYLGKMREVFDLFRERDDVILLWRPHPLLRSTVRSMRLQLAKQYDELENWFKENGRGIYDDTLSPNNAIAISDAYIGDYSSLVFSFAIAGKPIFYTHPHCKSADRESYMFYAPGSKDRSAYAFAVFFNAIIKWAPKEYTAEIVATVPNEEGAYLYIDRVRCNDKIAFAPYRAQEIAIYDAVADTILKLPLPRPKIDYISLQNAKFSSAHVYENYVFLLPISYPGIVRIDMNTYEVRCIDDWLINNMDLYRKCTNHELVSLMGRSQLINGQIYAPFDRFPALLIFDCESCKGKIVHFNVRSKGYRSCCFDGEHLWIAPLFDGAIMRYDPKKYNSKEFSNYPESCLRFWNDGCSRFCFCCYSNGYIWLFGPFLGKPHIRLDPQTGEMMLWSVFGDEDDWTAYYDLSTQADGTVICTIADNTVMTLDFTGGQAKIVERKKLKIKTTGVNWKTLIDKAYTAQLTQAHDNRSGIDYIYSEQPSIFTIDNFIERLDLLKEYMPFQTADYKNLYINSDGTAGKKIYAHIVAEMLD
jgi:hypothetical protein